MQFFLSNGFATILIKLFILIKVTTNARSSSLLALSRRLLGRKYFKMNRKIATRYFLIKKKCLKNGQKEKKMPHNSKPQLLFSFHHHISTGLFFSFLLLVSLFSPGVTLRWNFFIQSLTWNSILKTTLLEQQQLYWSISLGWRYG